MAVAIFSGGPSQPSELEVQVREAMPVIESFEFQPDARLDDGEMWPVSFAVTKLTAGVVSRIAELVKKAAG